MKIYWWGYVDDYLFYYENSFTRFFSSGCYVRYPTAPGAEFICEVTNE